MRCWGPWLAALAVTGSIFWYLLSQIDPANLIDTAVSMQPRHLWVFVVLLLAGVVARATRFWLLLGRTVPLTLLTLIVMARNLFIDLLPARLGELSYVYLLTNRAGRPAEDGLTSMFLSVLFDVVAIAPLLLVAVLVVGSGENISAPTLAAAAIVIGLVAFGLMKAAVPIGGSIVDLLSQSSTRPSSWQSKGLRFIAHTVSALHDVERRHVFGQVLLISMVVRLCKFGSYYFLVLAIMGPLGYTPESLGFFRVFLGVVSAELVAVFPIHGIGGFGTFEAAWALSFSQLGFSTEDAILSGILAHATSQIVEYSLGGCALLYVMRPRATRT